MATYWENSCSFGLRYVSWYKYLIVSLVFSHLGFWSGNLFLIAPFPDLCLLVPFFIYKKSAPICFEQFVGLRTLNRFQWWRPVDHDNLREDCEALLWNSIETMFTIARCAHTGRKRLRKAISSRLFGTMRVHLFS